MFSIYWRCQKGGTGLQNAVLVLASFLFYALWDAGACGFMYDTAYHLNGRGVALRTNLLAEDIREVLVNE